LQIIYLTLLNLPYNAPLMRGPSAIAEPLVMNSLQRPLNEMPTHCVGSWEYLALKNCPRGGGSFALHGFIAH